jgi:hypothetical protein
MGSDFHCAAGNNWFVQVVGRKRWEFIMPEHTASVWPLKGGIFNFWTGGCWGLVLVATSFVGGHWSSWVP